MVHEIYEAQKYSDPNNFKPKIDFHWEIPADRFDEFRDEETAQILYDQGLHDFKGSSIGLKNISYSSADQISDQKYQVQPTPTSHILPDYSYHFIPGGLHVDLINSSVASYREICENLQLIDPAISDEQIESDCIPFAKDLCESPEPETEECHSFIGKGQRSFEFPANFSPNVQENTVPVGKIQEVTHSELIDAIRMSAISDRLPDIKKDYKEIIDNAARCGFVLSGLAVGSALYYFIATRLEERNR